MPSAINSQPATFLPMTFKTRTVAFEPETLFSLSFLKWSFGSLTRITDTMPRLMKKVATKMSTPIRTPRQVRSEKKRAKKSSITLQLTTRLQNRFKQLLHYVFRNAVEIELRMFRDFPELVEAARAGAFECEHLNQ